MQTPEPHAAFVIGQRVRVIYMGEPREGTISEIVPVKGRRRVFYKIDLGLSGKPAYAEPEIESVS